MVYQGSTMTRFNRRLRFALVLATLILFITMFTGKHKVIDRWEGWLMLVGYGVYTAYLIHRG